MHAVVYMHVWAPRPQVACSLLPTARLQFGLIHASMVTASLTMFLPLF